MLTDPIAVAAKAAVSVAGTLALVRVLGLDDSISATFAALVCVSPVAVTGVRLGLSQVVSSALGGAVTALLLALLGPTSPALAAAMAVTVWSVFRVGLGRGYLFAGFTVIYVFLVPSESPTVALWQRLAALAAGMSVATVVNTVVSAAMYRSIFRRRLALVRNAVADGFEIIAESLRERSRADRAAAAFDGVFPTLWSLGAELSDARREGWLRRRPRPVVDAAWSEVRALARLAHVGKELGIQVEAGHGPEGTLADDVAALARCLRAYETPGNASNEPLHRRAVAALEEANVAAGMQRTR